MVAGSLLTIGSLLLINNFASIKSTQQANNTTSFTVTKKPKKEEVKPERKPKPEPRRQRSSSAPPLINLDTSLSGIDFNLPGVDNLSNDVDNDILGDMNNVVMTDDTVDKPPVVIAQSGIQYPQSARSQGIEGFVIISLLINNLGEIEDIQILESTSKVFNKPAIDGVSSWKFKPAEYQGVPVKVWVRQKISFDLS